MFEVLADKQGIDKNIKELCYEANELLTS